MYDDMFFRNNIKQSSYLSGVLKEQEGVYFLFNKNNKLLYIGYSKDLKGRIKGHINGHTNASKFYKSVYKVSVIYTESFNAIRNKYKNIYDIEYFFIDQLKPKYNIIKSKTRAYIS
jgi:excinuclease ABC subunit C